MTQLEIIESADQAHLIDRVLTDLTNYLASAVANNKEVHIALTGGRVGTQIAKSLFANQILDSRLIHIWWSDERYLPAGDPQRNDSTIPTDFNMKAQIHRFASVTDSSDLTDAVARANSELHLHTTSRFCDRNVLMDISLLSIGPDGHVASLFPHHPMLQSTSGIVGITDSPKPPSQRITWTYPTLNASEQIWLMAAGPDKVEACKKLIAGADPEVIPASGVHGKLRTVLFTA